MFIAFVNYIYWLAFDTDYNLYIRILYGRVENGYGGNFRF